MMIAFVGVSVVSMAQDLPAPPLAKQQPITNEQLSKDLTTQAWGIMAGSAVFGALMIADHTRSDMNYGGYMVLSTGMAMGLTWHFRAKEARMKGDIRTADLH